MRNRIVPCGTVKICIQKIIHTISRQQDQSMHHNDSWQTMNSNTWKAKTEKSVTMDSFSCKHQYWTCTRRINGAQHSDREWSPWGHTDNTSAHIQSWFINAGFMFSGTYRGYMRPDKNILLGGFGYVFLEGGRYTVPTGDRSVWHTSPAQWKLCVAGTFT